ncbi:MULTISPECIES: PAC2 family protein [Dietzia]|jgi:proteasome assembly chaperone (PAC2) family protein|uniref:PAC2 family protein n=2 Tax=Dietzia TaxID=37914 RepID=A0A365PE54_9ACTN|nr:MULTISPECIES: PAC2 family protein [Dietzia]MBB0993682.1 PAC2 family protein [Dietzia sp. SLG510A3-40A3]MVZ89539.1 PAC2 family protein [Microbacter sp. ANSKLAB05]ODQ83927.1 carboxylate--amine ligase [Dietzia alimentaria]HBD22009.1 PAC2 family protein [Dietzia sp.]MBB0995567.1 PAC2 family protein [Dietzia maris]
MTVQWSPDGHLDLESPVMIVAFEGWNDAADVATGTIEHLALNWEARQIAEVGGDEFFDYLDQRPVVRISGGVSRSVEWPRVVVSACRPDGFAADVLLVRGPEPALKWRRFASEFVDLVDTLGVSQVILLGAYLADVPHTRPVPLTGAAFSRQRMATMGVEPSDYEGPTGMSGVLQQLLTEAGVPTLSVFAGVPHYVASPPNPRGTEAMLSWIAENLGMAVPMDALRVQARTWADRVDAAAGEDEDLRDYIQSLEDRMDEDSGVTPGVDPEPDRGRASGGEAMPLVDGDAIAAEFERFLRGERDEPDAG